ncbi:MAG: Rieske (2Fe-2S) protein [Phycisphaerae bacterium]|nr:Rieske (2Fe-2S) protein [Phycisphaerae bacterium]
MKPSESEGNPVSRREFSGAALGVASAAYAMSLGYPAYRFLAAAAQQQADEQQTHEVLLPKAALEVHPGEGTYFQMGHEPGLLIHYADGTWAAFSAFCTHLRCTVRYQPEQERIFCPCHEGVFDVRDGRALAGPPTRALPQWRVEIQGEDVRVSRA